MASTPTPISSRRPSSRSELGVCSSTMNVDDYIDSLPEDRRVAIRHVRELVNSHLPPGYEEGLQYGMISWFVPWTTLDGTYNNQPLALVSLGSQKTHMALYMMSIYGDTKLRTWFESAY